MGRVQGALRMSDEINKKFGYESAFGKNGGNGEITKIGISFNSDGTTSIFAELEYYLGRNWYKGKEQNKNRRKKGFRNVQHDREPLFLWIIIGGGARIC